ncbi:tetratricopeptide repeat-containing sulfotransferase family protein [Arenimonas fontis]|uniref:Tetratricopeptide repeat protein n=1 Tax=Arenimonas fontis TaxID=2608255 RepID=A0A5B2ZF72_9GAMM|nr:tetratricopeptide repeat-containing sulfotransferase family protein [Arenimonas fontis]KAA2285742.1 tetratricopeptide repeat protein [Arenimonas fontis]
MADSDRPLERARALAAAGRRDEALAMVLPLSQAGDPDAALALSSLRRSAGDEAAAFDSLREFVANPACRQRMVEMLLGERRNAEALRVLDHGGSMTGCAGHVAAAIKAHLAGDFRTALSEARLASELEPGNAVAHNHAARALHNLGRSVEARSALERAVALDPDYAEAWHNLGHVLRAMGQAHAAIDAFRRALEIAPGYRSARLNLAITLFEIQHADEALATFEQLLADGRADAEALVGSGLCLHLLGQATQARDRYLQALRLVPQHPAAWYYLGSVLNELGDVAGAHDALQRALAINPRDADAWAELAEVHELSNRLDEAQQAVAAGLAIAPDHPQLNIEAAKLLRRQHDPRGAELRLRALDARRMQPRVRQQFLYELGTVLDRLGRFEDAWQAFVQANTLASQSVRARAIEPGRWLRGVEALSAWLDRGAPGIEASEDGGADQGQDLCFLVGFPRSGTTLLDTILGAHPAITLLEEKPTLVPVIQALQRHPDGYPDALASLEENQRDELRRYYREALARHGATAGTLVVDKLPLRIIHLGLVQALFPRARVLLSLRHPCDVVLSNFMQQFAVNEAFVNFYSLADSVRMYDAVFGLWERLRPRLRLPIMEVRYEELVDSPERVAAAALGFLGLDWDPGLLETSRRTSGRERITTNSYHQVAEPIYRHSVGRWLHYRSHFTLHLPVLRPHVERLGYGQV